MGDPRQELEHKMARLGMAAQMFSPSAPVDQKTLFAGRIQQLSDVITAVNQRGQHVVLFGERGVGKTSLARTVLAICAHHRIAPEPLNCDPTSTFESMWRKAFRAIQVSRADTPVGFTSEPRTTNATLDQFLPASPSPEDIRQLIANVKPTLIVFDEFDRVQDRQAQSLMADTIKTLSDHLVSSTVMIVGVADSVQTLISEHRSIERALVQIRMPRMSKQELFEIVDKGLKPLTMTIDPLARERIAILSQGLPHYTHLLALHGAQAAISDDKPHIDHVHVRAAIEKALAQAQQSTVVAYHKATSSPRENLYPQVLLACALAKTDGLGYFAATDVKGPMSKLMRRPYDIPAFSLHLNKFCDNERGPILQKTGEARRFRFRFMNPLMQPYIVMDGIQRGVLNEDQLA
jgi:energy-coupling factor transporter ATP-binding protein EcfA2